MVMAGSVTTKDSRCTAGIVMHESGAGEESGCGMRRVRSPHLGEDARLRAKYLPPPLPKLSPLPLAPA